jgi:hypothetical protein
MMSVMSRPSSEITFAVEEAPEGGYLARAVGHDIFTEADSPEGLREAVRRRALPFRRGRSSQDDPPALRAGGDLAA